MNWHNLSDKEFDAKLKAHVEGKQVPFDTSAWDKMQAKLNRAGFSTNGSSWGLATIVLILAGIFFWSVGNYSGTASQSITATADVSKSVSGVDAGESMDSNKNADAPSPENQSMQNPIKAEEFQKGPGGDDGLRSSGNRAQGNDPTRSAIETPQNDLPVEHASPNIAPGDLQADPTISGRPAIVTEKQSEPTLKDNSQTDVPGQESSSAHFKGSTTANMGKRPAKPAVGAADKGLLRGYSGKSLALQGPFLQWMAMPQFEAPPVSEQADLKPPPVVEPKVSPWSLGATYAPDLSLVGFSKLSKPGTNVALSVDYQLHARWSVQTGIIYAKKMYVARGREYTPPKGFWTNGIWPEQTEAACKVIDIPLNVRYYFNHSKNHNWFISTGLSTYLMLKEHYYYEYEQDDPSLVHFSHVNNENQHLFGIYNLSLGYQKELSSRWFLEIEPFIKAPIAGIGFGEVKLWSTGTMFSLRHRFR